MASFNHKQSVARKPIFKLQSARQRRIRMNQMRSIIAQNAVPLSSAPIPSSSSNQQSNTTVNLQVAPTTSAGYTGGTDATHRVDADDNSSSSAAGHVGFQYSEIPSKPAFLPISSLAGMTDFENIDDDGYDQAVNYFRYMYGLNLKATITYCFKATFSDCLLTSYSWMGRGKDNLPLCETRAVAAIYDGVYTNARFLRPTRKEMADCMKVALRTAHKRVRSKRRGPRNPPCPIVDSFWTAEEESD